MRPLGIVLRGRFSFVTTSETKIGFLLIAVFERFFNPQNKGHLEACGHNYIAWVTRLHICYYGILTTNGLQVVSSTKRYFFESPWVEWFYSLSIIMSYTQPSVCSSMLRVTSTTPFDDTLKPFALSCSRSKPITVPSGISQLRSMMACLILQCRLMIAPGKIIVSSMLE